MKKLLIAFAFLVTTNVYSQQNLGIDQSNPQAKVHVTQTGSQDALIVEDESSDPTPFIVDQDGNVISGGKITTDSLMIPYGASDGAVLKSDPNGNAVWNELNIAVYQDKSMVQGGSSVIGWQTRILNHTETQIGSAISANFSTNEITIQPGSYKIRASAPCYRSDFNQLRMRNVANSNILALGTSQFASNSNDGMSRSIIDQVVTVSAATTFIIEHYMDTVVPTYGLGLSTTPYTGEPSIYTTIYIEKIK